MRWLSGPMAVLLVISIACEAREEPVERAAPPAADTAGLQDSAAAVGDTLMARDTMP